MSRLGQGMLNSETNQLQLLKRILGDLIMAEKCIIIADDIVVGGKTKNEALSNYEAVISRLSDANLKLTPEKTHIFPEQVTLHGWLLKDGLIHPDPHRQLALLKIEQSEIKTSTQLKSWIGLFKTFLPAMSGSALWMDPLDQAVAGKEPKTPITWSSEMSEKFALLKDKAKNEIHSLALPAKDEQLILLPDATVASPGIGFVLMVVRYIDNEKTFLPVLFLSFKLKTYHRKWYPCEQEALGASVAVEKSAYFIRQSSLRTIVAVDSKPVFQAFELIKSGKFSSSSRMHQFLQAIGRFPLNVQHISGKFRCNVPSDYLSRNPAQCTDPNSCQMCKFIEERSTSVLCSLQQANPHILATSTIDELISGNAPTPFANRAAWKKLQLEDPSCNLAIQHKISNSPLPKKNRDKHAHLYLTQASLSKTDKLLVVRTQDQYQSTPRERIVIPKSFVPALVSQLHQAWKCPAMAQLSKVMERYFFGIGMNQAISDARNNCHTCIADKKLPDQFI